MQIYAILAIIETRHSDFNEASFLDRVRIVPAYDIQCALKFGPDYVENDNPTDPRYTYDPLQDALDPTIYIQVCEPKKGQLPSIYEQTFRFGGANGGIAAAGYKLTNWKRSDGCQQNWIITPDGNWGGVRSNFVGEKGFKGVKGEPGLCGAPGSYGVPGRNGIDGVDGACGAQGAPGQNGPQGASAAQGPQGIVGVRGFQGVSGIKGNNGTEGQKGQQGTQGSVGFKGVVGTTGPQGAAGSQGISGPRGDQGITGPQGPQGPTGPQGPVGAQGDQGERGFTGPTGAQGANGANGAQGIKGIDGDQGVSGSMGDTGPVGFAGPIGLTGDQGAKGVNGATGDVGATGPQGATGPIGPIGITGGRGATGAVGLTGPPGNPGAQGGTGRNGDSYCPASSYYFLQSNETVTYGILTSSSLTWKISQTVQNIFNPLTQNRKSKTAPLCRLDCDRVYFEGKAAWDYYTAGTPSETLALATLDADWNDPRQWYYVLPNNAANQNCPPPNHNVEFVTSFIPRYSGQLDNLENRCLTHVRINPIGQVFFKIYEKANCSPTFIDDNTGAVVSGTTSWDFFSDLDLTGFGYSIMNNIQYTTDTFVNHSWYSAKIERVYYNDYTTSNTTLQK